MPLFYTKHFFLCEDVFRREIFLSSSKNASNSSLLSLQINTFFFLLASSTHCNVVAGVKNNRRKNFFLILSHSRHCEVFSLWIKLKFLCCRALWEEEKLIFCVNRAFFSSSSSIRETVRTFAFHHSFLQFSTALDDLRSWFSFSCVFCFRATMEIINFEKRFSLGFLFIWLGENKNIMRRANEIKIPDTSERKLRKKAKLLIPTLLPLSI